MRASIIISTIFAASTLAAPLAAPAKRDISLDNLEVGTGGVNLDGLNVDLDDVTDLVEGLDLPKRQLGLDLGLDLDLTPVTDLVGGLLDTVTGLLPGLTSEIASVESLVTGLLDGTITDVEGTITQITALLNDVLVQLGGLDLGDLASLTKRQVNADASVDVDLSSLITTVTGLVDQVTSLTSLVDVATVLDLVNDVLNTLTSLTSVLGLKKH